MASIFATCEEGVFRYTQPGKDAVGGCESGSVGVITISDSAAITMAPITGFRLELSSNHQFLHTLNNFIYVFSFGDRVGELTVSGIAATGCYSANSGESSKTGSISALYKRYLDNRLAANLKPSLITITGADVSLLGFLTGMSMEIPNPAMPIAQWAFRYNVIINAATKVPRV